MKMKWRVDIEYEDGSFTEPRRIAFQAVYDGEPYHGYDTKREALEAFCVGQVAMDELRKGREKEQHKINPCEPQTNREDMDFDTGQAYTWEQKEREAEQKPEERIGVIRDFSPEGLEKRFGGWNEAIREAHKSPIEKVEERLDLLERYLGISKHKMKQTVATLFVEQDKRLEALEEAIRKPYIPFPVREAKDIVYKYQAKVEALEKKVDEHYGTSKSLEEILGAPKPTIQSLTLNVRKMEMDNAHYEIVLGEYRERIEKLEKKVEELEAKIHKKNVEETEEINEALEMVDKGKADTFYEQVNKTSKNDYKECKANPFRCEKCGLEFKIVSQERALVEHCPSCGDKPKRIED